MNLSLTSVAGVYEIVRAFFGGEGGEYLADGGADGFDGSCGLFAQEMLELGEHLLDGVQIGRVLWGSDRASTSAGK